MTTLATQRTDRLPDGLLARLGIGAALAATVNLALFALGHATGASMLVPDTADPDTFIDLPAGLVAAASIIPLLPAAALSSLLSRAPRRARPIYLATIGAGFVLSFIPTFTAGMTAGTTAVLALMHPVVAGAAALLAPEPANTPR